MAVDTSAATTATNALQAIPFDTLIGGPLDACINAQAKAAKTTWEFIEHVGLTQDKNGEKKAVNVTFQYNKNGQMVNLVVPILTIVPIPYLAIDQVIIDFKANISASSSNVNETSTSENIEAGGSAKGSFGWGPFSVSFEAHANYSSKKDSKATQESKYSVEYTMDVHVQGGQADMPAGLASVLNILQSSVMDAPVGGGVTLSPNNGTIQAAQGAKIYIEATFKDDHGVLQKNTTCTFNLSDVPTGMTLKTLEITRGTQGSSAPTATTAEVVTDDKGAGGVTIIVESIDQQNYAAGLMTMEVNGMVTDNNVPDGGKTDVKNATKIKTTAALAPPTPAPPTPGTVTLTPSPASVTGVDSNSGKPITITADENSSPKSGVAISATSADTSKLTVTPTSGNSDAQGKVAFTVKKAGGNTGDKVKVTFTASGSSPVDVECTLA